MFCLSTRKYFFNILPAHLARIFTKKKSEFYYYEASERALQALVTLFTPAYRDAGAAGKNHRPKNKTSISARTKIIIYIYLPAMLPACKTFLLNSIFTTLVKHFSDISTNKVTCCFANTGCLMRRLGECGHVPFVRTQKRALNVSAQFVLLVFFLLGHFSHYHTSTQSRNALHRSEGGFK